MSQEIRVMKPQDGWPISRTNGGSAVISEVMAKPSGIHQSHYLTGFILSEGADGDGFTLLRRACIAFDSATDTITVSDGAGVEPGTADFGLVFGIKMTAGQVTLTEVFDKFANSNGYKVDVDANGRLVFTMGDGAATATVTTLNPINDGNWHQIVITCDRDSATGLKIYVDGVLSNTADPRGAQLACTGGIENLVFTGTASKTFWLSTWALYVLALPVAETLWAGGAGCKFVGNEAGISASYNFEEGTGTTATDRTGSLNGTLANTAWVDGDGLPIDAHTLKRLGQIAVGALTTSGGFSGLAVMFPHAIKVGRNNPIRLNETDGAWNAILFGYTDGG